MSESRLANILDAMVDGVYVANQRHELEYVNPALARVFGPWQGRKCYEYLEDRADVCPGCPGLDSFDGARRWEWASRKTGRVYDVVDSLVINPDGTRSKLEILRDITELKREQEQAADEARRKDAFVALLAHELRTPLTPLLHAAQVIAGGGDRELADAASQIVVQQVRHMSRLIDDLLDASRVTRGVVILRREPVRLGLVLESVLKSNEPTIADADVKLEVISEGDIVVEADPVRLCQILSNLLGNALKFTDPGGLVRIEVARQRGEAVVRITDTGVGISREELPRIFEMFVRARPDDTRGGLGIGLALARTLARLHGGEIRAHSAGRGRGSTFELELPIHG